MTITKDTKLFLLLTTGLCAALFIFLFFVVAPSSAYAVGICTTNSDCNFINGIAEYWTGPQTCKDKEIWQDYLAWTCVNPNTIGAYCTSSKINKYQTTCSNGCQNGRCIDGSTGGGSGGGGGSSCTSHSYVKCSNNAIYWFNSCNSQEGLYQACGNGCSTNATSCNGYTQPPYTNPNPYVYHSVLGCQNNISYWYDSNGAKNDVYKNCNSTGQTCQNGDCVGPIVTPTTTTTTTKPKTTTASANNCKPTDYLAISIFGQRKSDSQWTKNFKVSDNDQVNFIVVVKNMSGSSLENVNVKLDSSNFIPATYNLAIDSVGSDKNILTGINLASMPAGSSTLISFSGSVKPKDQQETVKITSSSGDLSGEDSLTVDIERLNPTLAGNNDTKKADGSIGTAAVSESPLADFFKKWYVWMILGVVLIFLFVIIFRRLSSNNN